ncbi:DNA translocase FtsK [Salmonella enterica subsp. arizonae]|uniref:DNA translocase FtsK n=1 Tax=Salmonella enterica subsp. arizonae TaxID=59203 RepID=A0A379SKJ0_SALER|nr:DNA translocase FtsK [Salmonella enterica subsp. arizonae]
MSQEYTEDKDVTLTKLSSGRRLLEALLILIALFAVWLMAALLSFNPSDPSWSQTAWHEPIHNLGGAPGAWLADTLFFIFGVMAYTIPVIIVGGCWFAWRHQSTDDYIDYFAVSLRLIGVLALILTSCGLAAINADDIWYFASGGVIGSLLSTTLQPLLHSSGGTITLLCIWAAGLTLFTGWSWVSIAEKLGGWLLNILTFASNRTRRDDTWVDDEEYEDEYDEETDGVQRESRRARILRGALARRKRLAAKFSNPRGRQTDAALFSGKRMDDGEDIQYSARGVAADPDDVLFSGNRATQPEYDEYDPLLNGHSVAEPVAAAAAATAVTPDVGYIRRSRNANPVHAGGGCRSTDRGVAARTGAANRRTGYRACAGGLPIASSICSTAGGAGCAVAATCACCIGAEIRCVARDRSGI